MENVNFKNSKGLNLVGIFYPSESDKGIIICHGFTADKDRERLVKLAEVFSKNGFAILRFNFSGSGESDKAPISVQREYEDLKSAIEFMKTKNMKNIGLIGESLGGLISLMAYSEIVKTMVLLAPVTNKRRPHFEKDIIKTNENAEESNGKFLLQKKDGRIFEISDEYLEERATINRDKILSKVKCPVLIIHGTLDTTIPLEWSRYAIEHLPRGSELKIVEGAGHKLEEKLNEVIELSVGWFKENLK